MKKLVAMVLCTAMMVSSVNAEAAVLDTDVSLSENAVETTETMEEADQSEMDSETTENVTEETESVPEVTENAAEEMSDTTEQVTETEEVVSETTEEVTEETETVTETTEKVTETVTETTEEVTEERETTEFVEKSATMTKKSVTATAGCTAADLQKLLDTNAEGKYELTVKIPAGTYKLTRSLYVYPHTTIKADKAAKLVKQSGYGALIEVKLIADDGGYDGNDHITIDGGIWDSTPVMKSSSGTETFRFIHSNTITIKNATLCNVPEGSHLIVFAGVQNATVTNCKFYGYQNWKTAKTPKEAVQLDTAHSEIQVPTNQGDQITWDDLACDNITITDCEFYNYSRGIGSHTAVAGRLHTNVTINNNKFHDLSDSAIRLYNYKDTVVSGNVIDKVEEGILAYTYMENVDDSAYFDPLDGVVGELPADYNIRISGNTITNVKDTDNIWGDGIRVIGKDDRKMAGVKITGNTITTTSRYGIFATAAPAMTVDGNNVISATTSDAILLEKGCDQSVIKETTVKGSKKAGISIYNSNGVSVTNNTVSSANSAIYLLDSQSCVIGGDKSAGNTVTSTGASAISLSVQGTGKNGGCTSSQVTGNTVLNAGEHGIFVYKGQKVTVADNVVNAAGKNGIFVSTSCNNANVKGNTVQTAKENGIAVTSKSLYATVTGNTILAYGTANKGGSRYGIMIYQSGGNAKKNTIVKQNRVTGTGKVKGRNGIQISESAYTTVSGNVITKPNGSGIFLFKSKNCKIGSGKKDYNTIKSSTEQGIYLTCNCDGGKVQYNKITGAKAEGIGSYQSKKLTINANTVSSKADGIYINTSSSMCKITNNVISSAGANGIRVSSKSTNVTVNGNTIKKYASAASDGCGIYVYQSGGKNRKSCSTVNKNKITGTGKSTNKNGIKVSESSFITMDGNTLTNIQGTAIYVYKSKNASLNKNVIKTPKKRGIYLTTSCDNAKITANTVTKPGDTAIATYKAPKTLISSNKITTTKKLSGIWVSNSNSTQVKSNTVTGAKKKKAIIITSSKKCKNSKNKIK